MRERVACSSFSTLFVLLTFLMQTAAQINRCYSCASSNMQRNFLQKQRGPPNRLQEPRAFDDACNIDTWLLKERGTEDCAGGCFKWQQLLNNSGAMSMMTFRGCYRTMFDISNPSTFREPGHTFCTNGEQTLTCLADASIIDSSCWCYGDLCNSVQSAWTSLLSSMALTLLPCLYLR